MMIESTHKPTRFFFSPRVGILNLYFIMLAPHEIDKLFIHFQIYQTLNQCLYP